MEIIKKVFQQTSWQVIVKFITSISGFIILSAVARNYGESGTGSFTLALTFLAFFYVLTDFSFNAHILERLQRDDFQIEWRKLLGVRIIWSVGLMIVATLLILVLPSSQFSTDFKYASLLGIITIFFYSLNVTAHALFQSKLKYHLDILPTLVGVSLGTVLIVYFSNIGAPVYLAVLGYVVAWLIHSAGTLFFASRIVKSLSPIIDLGYLKHLIKEIWPMAATLVLNVVYFRIDSFILSSYWSLADVGIYNTAYQVFQAVLVLPTFIMNSFYPLMLQTIKLDMAKFLKQIQLASLVLLSISVVISIVIYFLSGGIINLITGGGFVGSVNSLQILSFGLPAYFLSNLFMWIMVAKKKYKSLLIIYAIGLSFNLGANLYLIPRSSYIGASWVTVISEYLILILLVTILYPTVKEAISDK